LEGGEVTHPRAGTNKERQSIGDPGHCERCAEIGHIRAHPSLGCGDVGCEQSHALDEPTERLRSKSMGETMRIIGTYREAVQAVRALHHDMRLGEWTGTYCNHCRFCWPCPTEQAIRSALGEDKTEVIEATLDEIIARMVKAADQPCPKCHRRVGDHDSTVLHTHLTETWGKIAETLLGWTK
jgi:hypothetical protein